MSTQLAVAKQGADALLSAEWTEARLALVARTIAKGATPDELALFTAICQRTGLDPFKRQIYAIKRYDAREGRDVMQTQVSIDGLRLIAQRSGAYRGQVGPWWCGPDGDWRDVWLEGGPPAAAKVGVLRDGYTEPLMCVATYAEYAQTKKDGSPNAMWAKMPANMLAKVCESLALRKAFPDEGGGLYTAEEMGQARHGEHLEGVVDVRGMVRGAWGTLQEKIGQSEAAAWVAATVEAKWPGRVAKDLTDDEAGVLLEALEEEIGREEVVDEGDGEPKAAKTVPKDEAGGGPDSRGASTQRTPADAEASPAGAREGDRPVGGSASPSRPVAPAGDAEAASSPEDPVAGGAVSTHPVTGSKGDAYVVSVYEDGSWDCTCPARTADCRHVRSIRRPFPEGSGWLWPGDEEYDKAPAAPVPGGAPETPRPEEEAVADGAPSPAADVFGALIAFGEALGLTMDQAVRVIADCGFGTEALTNKAARGVVESALRSAAKAERP